MPRNHSESLSFTPQNTLWGRPVAGQRNQQARTVTEIPPETLPDALSQTPLRLMYAGWSAAVEAGGESPPSRDHFHPQGIKSALGRIMIVSREPYEVPVRQGGPDTEDTPERQDTPVWTYRYRLVGTDIVTTFGQDFTGQTIEVFHPPLRAMVRDQFDQVFERLTPIAARITSIVDHLMYDYEKLVLPSRSMSGGPVDQAVVTTFQVKPR